MPLPKRRALVRSVALHPSQPVRRVNAVSGSSLSWLECLAELRPSFDLCEESGASGAFFPEGRGALSGHYEQVSCKHWSGSDGPSLWNGACLAGKSAPSWPFMACGNTGTEPSPWVRCEEFWLRYTLGVAPV